MSKTKTSTKALPNAQAPAQPHTGRRTGVATGSEQQRTARKAAPAVIKNAPAPMPRPKGRAAPSPAPSPTGPAVAVPVTRRPSKVASIQVLLRRAKGAAITELMAVTGWQQHSVRAALTGLRKQGHDLIKEPAVAGGSVYRIAQDQPAKA